MNVKIPFDSILQFPVPTPMNEYELRQHIMVEPRMRMTQFKYWGKKSLL